jgi:hypothetical protein
MSAIGAIRGPQSRYYPLNPIGLSRNILVSLGLMSPRGALSSSPTIFIMVATPDSRCFQLAERFYTAGGLTKFEYS